MAFLTLYSFPCDVLCENVYYPCAVCSHPFLKLRSRIFCVKAVRLCLVKHNDRLRRQILSHGKQDKKDVALKVAMKKATVYNHFLLIENIQKNIISKMFLFLA